MCRTYGVSCQQYYSDILFAACFVRSITIEHHSKDIDFYLPCLVQLMRVDVFGACAVVLDCFCRKSTLTTHALWWLLDTESNNLSTGSDDLPKMCRYLAVKIKVSLTRDALAYLTLEVDHFKRITGISAELNKEKNKDRHKNMIKVRKYP